jgi:hypothetical protein
MTTCGVCRQYLRDHRYTSASGYVGEGVVENAWNYTDEDERRHVWTILLLMRQRGIAPFAGIPRELIARILNYAWRETVQRHVFPSPLVRLPCNHFFHDACLMQWLHSGPRKGRTPVCPYDDSPQPFIAERRTIILRGAWRKTSAEITGVEMKMVHP